MPAGTGRRTLPPMRSAWGLVAGGSALVLAAAGCGGGGGAVTTKAAWTAKHGAAVTNLNSDIETAQATLSSLQRTGILGDCTQVEDSLAEARKGLPVPDPTVDAALRASLDAVAPGAEDCVQGARGPDIPRLEKSFSELREAHTLLDVARRTIDAWR